MNGKRVQVDIVIPVFNESGILEKNISILVHFLSKNADFDWNIIIADNGSTDNTLSISKKIASGDNRIRALHIPVKGRGLALRTSWLRSEADIVSYMDADLSTNIRYFPMLIEGIRRGYDISIGSRLMGASRIKRNPKREIISRVYNLMLKILFFNRFSDAQCGFKALKIEAARFLIPKVKNNSWFFDTELLLLAERYKYRIFEIPVEWIDDLRETKLNIPQAIGEDLLGMLRMRFGRPQ